MSSQPEFPENNNHVDEESSVLTGDYDEGGSPNGESQYTHYRSLIEKRIEQRRIEEDSQLTFKPQLYEYKKGLPTSTESANRFDKLYKDAKKRQADVVNKSVLNEQNSFQPTLVARSSSRGKRAPSPQNLSVKLHSQSGAGNPKAVQPEDHSFQPAITRKALEVSRSGGDVADRLYQKSYEIKEKQERRRAEHEQQKNGMEECTFSPQLLPNTRSLSASRIRKSLNDGEAVPKGAADRLYKYDEQKRNRMELLRKAKEEVESAEITFQPKLVTSATAVSYRSSTPTRSVYERLGEGGNTMSVGSPDNPECTFQPQITKQSADLAKSRSSDRALHDRLYEEAERKKKDLQTMLNNVLEEERKDITFSPSLLTAKHLSHHLDNRKPVFERLSDSTDKKQLSSVMTQLRNELEMAECTFHPQTNVSNGRSTPSSASDIPVHARLSAEADKLKALATRREELKAEAELRSPLLVKNRTPSAQRAVAAANGTPIEANSARKPVAAGVRTTPNNRAPSPSSQSGTPRSASNSRATGTPSRFAPSPTPSMGSVSMASTNSARRLSASPSPIRTAAETTVTPKARYGQAPAVADNVVSPSNEVARPKSVSASRVSPAPTSATTTPVAKTPLSRAPSATRSKPSTAPSTVTPTSAPRRTATTPSRTPVSSSSKPIPAASAGITPPTRTAASKVASGTKSTPSSMSSSPAPPATAPAHKVLKGRAAVASSTVVPAVNSTDEAAGTAEKAMTAVDSTPLQKVKETVEMFSASPSISTPVTTAVENTSTKLAPASTPTTRRSPVPVSSSSSINEPGPPPHKVLRGRKKSESRDTSPVPPQLDAINSESNENENGAAIANYEMPAVAATN